MSPILYLTTLVLCCLTRITSAPVVLTVTVTKRLTVSARTDETWSAIVTGCQIIAGTARALNTVPWMTVGAHGGISTGSHPLEATHRGIPHPARRQGMRGETNLASQHLASVRSTRAAANMSPYPAAPNSLLIDEQISVLIRTADQAQRTPRLHRADHRRRRVTGTPTRATNEPMSSDLDGGSRGMKSQGHLRLDSSIPGEMIRRSLEGCFAHASRPFSSAFPQASRR